MPTPLMKAAKRGNFKVVKYLLCWNADVEARGKKSRTALMLGAASGCARTVECLLQSNPLVNAQDKNGWTALMYAASGNHRDVVEVLVATPNTDRRASNRHGLTAEDLTTCPILKGLLQVSGGIGLFPLPSGLSLRPPLVNFRPPQDPTLATGGLGLDSLMPVKVPPEEVGGATANTGFPHPCPALKLIPALVCVHPGPGPRSQARSVNLPRTGGCVRRVPRQQGTKAAQPGGVGQGAAAAGRGQAGGCNGP
jgi:ankyrin repeat protein